MKRLIALVTLLALLGAAQPAPPTAEAAGPGQGCEAGTIWGFCFDTLPKLWCCSSAFLGWSEIVVGDTFVVSGRVAPLLEPNEKVEELIIRFPSGRRFSLPVGTDSTFRMLIPFDEEGSYRVILRGEREMEAASFQVAYRAQLLDLPTVESQFGRQHARTGVTMGILEAGVETDLRIRFTDAKGEPVRSRTLAIGWGQQVYTTDSEGVATIRYQPDEWEQESGYLIRRLYPGLGLVSYREVQIGGDGWVSGLPGGEVKALFREGRWYLPLRETLEKAAPMRLGDMPERIEWEEASRTIRIEDLRIMLDTGMVLGGADFRTDLIVVDGRAYMDLHSLIQLLDRLGMAQRTGEFTFRLSMAQEP